MLETPEVSSSKESREQSLERLLLKLFQEIRNLAKLMRLLGLISTEEELTLSETLKRLETLSETLKRLF